MINWLLLSVPLFLIFSYRSKIGSLGCTATTCWLFWYESTNDEWNKCDHHNMEELEALARIFFLSRSSCSSTALDHRAHPVLVKWLRILELLQLWQGSVCLEFFLLKGLVLLLEFDNLVNHSLLIDVIVICLYLRLRGSGRAYPLLLSNTFSGTCCLWLNRCCSRGRASCCWSSCHCFFALCNT